MWEEPAGRRSLPVALEKLERARLDVLGSDEYAGLDLGDQTEAEFVADAEDLVRNYFRLEDPDQVVVLGTELLLSVEVGAVTLRGIIDRLELDECGELVITDYKTGRAPEEAYEQTRLGGVHFYAFLCEQVLGRRPARVQLLHLREPLAISTVPSEQSIRGLRQQTSAIWSAIEQACDDDDFRPHPGRGALARAPIEAGTAPPSGATPPWPPSPPKRSRPDGPRPRRRTPCRRRAASESACEPVPGGRRTAAAPTGGPPPGARPASEPAYEPDRPRWSRDGRRPNRR